MMRSMSSMRSVRISSDSVPPSPRHDAARPWIDPRSLLVVGPVLLGLLLSTASGCSRPKSKWARARPPVYKATGQVTWNGEPANGAVVVLSSKAHNLAAVGNADADGRFTLTTWDVGDGGVAGEHLVGVEKDEIVGYEANGSPIRVNVLPPKYQNPETSGLTATIVERGPNVLSIDVVGPRHKAPKTGP